MEWFALISIDQIPLKTDAVAHFPYSAGMEASLKFVSTYGDEVSMSIRNGDELLVPRRLVTHLGKDFRISRPVPAIECRKPPRSEEQAECIAKSVFLLREGVDHILEAPTGFGKTYLGCAIAGRLGQTTLILMTKQDLMDSWRETLINLVGVPPDQIGIAQADKLDYKGKRFVLSMVQSVTRPGKYDSEFFNSFGLIIFDETHRMAAETFSQACTLFPAKHRLGLSATPKRSDGKTPVLAAHIGPVMVQGTSVPMSPKVLIQETGWKIPAWMAGSVKPGQMMGVYKAMSQDIERNMRIVQFVHDAYAKGRTIVVMSDIVEHLKKLQVLCGTLSLPGEEMGFYIGENKKTLKFNGNKRIVFATYGMCSEGTDFPAWDSLVMATPRSNIKQPLGRILRMKEGKRKPVCLDLLDSGSIFKGFFHKRQQQYFEIGSEMVRL